MSARLRVGAPLLAALLAAALAPPPAPAAEGNKLVRVTLKDGTVLQGVARRQGQYEVDPDAKSVIFMPSGFFFIDDEPRRIYFSPNQMSQLDEIKPPDGGEMRFAPKRTTYGTSGIPPVFDCDLAPSEGWDDNGKRELKYRGAPRRVTIKQRIDVITPYYVCAKDTSEYAWPACYLTSEIGPAVVAKVWENDAEYGINDKTPPAQVIQKRYDFQTFCLQAGWFDEAEEQLDRVLRDAPDEAANVAKYRAVVRQWRCRENYNNIKTIYNAGQYKAVRDRLAAFPLKDAAPETAADVQAFKAGFDEADKKLDDAKRFLKFLPQDPGARNAVLADAAAAIAADATVGDMDRLDLFVSQAKQAEKQRAAAAACPKAERPKVLSPDELLALAVTGWMMGKGAEEPTPAAAERLWYGRTFVMKYLRADRAGRAKLLEEFIAKGKDAPSLDDLLRVIPKLPPLDPDQNPAVGKTVKVSLGDGRRGAPSYQLRLPEEYRHSGSYPVLIVLHDAGQKPDDMLERWAKAAGDNGYILAAPEWDTGNGVYSYTDDEHAVVLKTLADLRRKYAVDSDRVFLFGLGQGGAAAFDIGLSHPDQFAGVLPMSAAPAKFAERYWKNGQYLPFYVVDGDRTGDLNKALRALFTDWVDHSYPMLWVQYKCRGMEWFGGEPPLMFDWMRTKKRAFPLQQLGAAGGAGANLDQFTTQRATDDRFYWITADAIRPACLNSAGNFKKSIAPATLAAKIDPTENKMLVFTEGIDQLTIWLDRNGSMIDFDKPLKIHLNTKGVVFNEKVAPSLSLMLDDLAERGDRQRLFLSKVELKVK
jgi:pimeloyl-ACP methyl ester carboxylesterase